MNGWMGAVANEDTKAQGGCSSSISVFNVLIKCVVGEVHTDHHHETSDCASGFPNVIDEMQPTIQKRKPT